MKAESCGSGQALIGVRVRYRKHESMRVHECVRVDRSVMYYHQFTMCGSSGTQSSLFSQKNTLTFLITFVLCELATVHNTNICCTCAYVQSFLDDNIDNSNLHVFSVSLDAVPLCYAMI